MTTPHLFAFLLTAAAFVLLMLITFSVPFISNFYFLRTSASGGVDFGVWGFCAVNDGTCSKETIGYSFGTEITFWLTQALVLYPVAAGLTFLTLLSMIPMLCMTHRHHHHHHHHGYSYASYYPTPLFAILSLLSLLTSFFAFIFMIALFSTAMQRFKDGGFGASFGPLPWMSIGATVALGITALSSGCGMMCHGRFSRMSARLRYTV